MDWIEIVTGILSIIGVGGGVAALKWRKYIMLGIFVVKKLKEVGRVKRDLELAAELGNTFGVELSEQMTKRFGNIYEKREIIVARFFREAVKGALRDNA